MANSKSSATSILGIIAIILVIAAAAYFLMNEADDDVIQIDIGLVDDEAPRVVVSSRYVDQGSPIVFEG